MSGSGASAEATWVRVCPVESVEVDRPEGVLVGDSGTDRDRVCVARRGDGEPVAMLDRCPHRDIALSGGGGRDGLLTCPGHFWRFALEGGVRTDKPDEIVTLYPTRVVDGWVEALLPPVPRPMGMREWLLEQARAAPRTGTSPPFTGSTPVRGHT